MSYTPVRRSALQDWVMDLTVMQQSVLLAAIRGPDGIKKNHPVKVLLRWYRRCTLISAFDRVVMSDPYSPGGGSFTGPCLLAEDIFIPSSIWGKFNTLENFMSQQYHEFHLSIAAQFYLESIDELPHHFQLHFMHAAEILGYKHPDTTSTVADGENTRLWWRKFYLMIVNDAHLFPESEEQMDTRLGDNEQQWRAREEVIAR